MSDNSEYDALGELFRQRLENHRIPVDVNDWDEIRRQLGKGKNKIAIWSWRIGAVAAAASVAALLIFNRPETDETDITLVSQQVTAEENGKAHHEVIPATPQPEMKEPAQVEVAQSAEKVSLRSAEFVVPFDEEMIAEASETEVALLDPNKIENQEVNHSVSHSVVKDVLDFSLVKDYPDEDEAAAKKTEKWLLAAALGMGGNTSGNGNEPKNLYNDMNMPAGWDGMGRGNLYATEMSSSIKSFSNMSREEFTKLSHRPPLSLGVTARKSHGKHGAFESGLVYTCLVSHFEWSGHHVQQSLHYVGIPLNVIVYTGNFKSNWQVYLSGGFMVEKGLRAVYRQEREIPSEHRVTTVRSHITGLQGSLNGALGVNYKLEKGWGLYFEPRLGYSFDCSQPVSIRTEYPFYFGINLGLNYEL